MNTKRLISKIMVRSLLLTLTTLGSVHAFGATQPQHKSATSSVSTEQSALDVKGTWSGTFFSRHSNVRSFTLTVVINADSRGHLVGSSSLNSDCLKGAHLQVSVTGTKVVLAGGNEEGDNLTIRGEIENGTLLKAQYVLNGSATGSCETDDGTGTLAKRQ
jgi:hypothetical protein